MGWNPEGSKHKFSNSRKSDQLPRNTGSFLKEHFQCAGLIATALEDLVSPRSALALKHLVATKKHLVATPPTSIGQHDNVIARPFKYV